MTRTCATDAQKVGQQQMCLAKTARLIMSSTKTQMGTVMAEMVVGFGNDRRVSHSSSQGPETRLRQPRREKLLMAKRWPPGHALSDGVMHPNTPSAGFSRWSPPCRPLTLPAAASNERDCSATAKKIVWPQNVTERNGLLYCSVGRWPWHLPCIR